jgi:ligand-binding sensor domain-containing protein
MAQTPDGWLWFGAPTGLYRFDGIQFERIALEGLDPRRSRAISVLQTFDSGALWIGYVYGGASLLKNGRFTHFGEAQGMGRGTVDSFAEDTHGATWVACADALRRYDGRQWTRVGSDWGFPDAYATAVFMDRHGTLWIAGEHEVFYLERQSQRFQPAGIRLENGDSGQFIESPDGRAWYTDDAGIHALPAQNSVPPRATSSNASTSAVTLIDHSGSVWRIGESKVRRFPFEPARGELLFKDRPDSDSLTARDVLSDSTVKTILEDREGNVWIATSGGVDRFRSTRVHVLPPAASALNSHALAPAENGSVWIGANCGLCSSPLDGLWKFDGRLKRMPVPGLTSVTAVDVDAHGTLWFAGPEGVWRQEGHERFRKVAEPPAGTRGQDIHALTIDLDGNPWVSVVRSSLFRYRDGAWE